VRPIASPPALRSTTGVRSSSIAQRLGQASKLEKSFLREGFKQVRGDEVMKAANEILDFRTVREKGIKAGKIKSIIHPSLASHVRREAVKFVDELKRV
jgi:hypothetical protein